MGRALKRKARAPGERTDLTSPPAGAKFEDYIKFMGHENMEDYNADFLVMLETWDAGKDFANGGGDNLTIAKRLGCPRSSRRASSWCRGVR